jgi:hypothetical protein
MFQVAIFINHLLVMPGLDPGIHAVTAQQSETPAEWIARSSPAMTVLVEKLE